MTIAVDFDGTIVEHEYPDIGEERPYATAVLRKLIEKRHKLILWTLREGKLLDEAVAWCKERGVEFYAVNRNVEEQMGDGKNAELSTKIQADLFIDDRAIGGLPTWTEIYEIVTHGVSYAQIIRRKMREELAAPEEPPYPAWMFWKHKKKRDDGHHHHHHHHYDD